MNTSIAQPAAASVFALGMVVTGYVALNFAALVLDRPEPAVAGLLLMIAVLLAPLLRAGRSGPWWLMASSVAVGTFACMAGLGDLLLDAMPILIHVALCGLFAASLLAEKEPLICRIVRLLEGSAHLAAPGVRSYARNLTLAWALLLGAQVILLALLLVLAWQGVAEEFAHAYARMGVYLVVALFFAGEYLFRRWHLRHIHHIGLLAQIRGMFLIWPKLLRGG